MTSGSLTWDLRLTELIQSVFPVRTLHDQKQIRPKAQGKRIGPVATGRTSASAAQAPGQQETSNFFDFPTTLELIGYNLKQRSVVLSDAPSPGLLGSPRRAEQCRCSCWTSD